MKKTLALVLALVLCLGAFAACGKSEEKAPAAKVPTLEEAKSYLFNMFKDNAEAPSVDFDVVAKVIIDGTAFDVTWSASIEEVKVIESKRESFWTVDLPFKNEAEKDYTLTATIKDAKGDTIEVSFARKLPKIDNTGVVNDPEAGVAYKLFLNQVSVGNMLYATGATQDDNKYIKTSIKPVEGLDFYAEAEGDGYKFYTTIDGVKNYVYAKTVDNNGKISKYVGYSAEQGTVWTYKADVNAWITDINGIKYVFGTYGTYSTFCISEATYITADNTGVSQFPASFMIKEIAESLAPVEGPTIYSKPEEIINAAYELELGGALSGGHKYTLTGVITTIDTPYDAAYGNVSVTMVVANLTDKPIQAFRLKGEGADTLEVGDTITVTGDIIKYDNKTPEGKVEMNAGCTLDKVVKAASLPSTPAEIVDALYGLEKGGKLEGSYSLTGKITSVDDPWSDQYKNITVTIVVEGKEDKPVVCFRIKGEGAEGLAVGDTITVTGELMNYADSSETGKREFNAGAVVSNIVKGEAPSTPEVHTHAFDEGKVTKAATCKEEGTKTYTCACGETKTEKIAKLNHTFDAGKVTKEATCKEEGTKTFTCACGETKTEKIAKLTTHKYDAGKITKQPTFDAKGIKTFTCTVCGATKTEDIAKLDSATPDVIGPAPTPDKPTEPETPSTPETPTTPAEIVDALYGLEKGGKLEGSYSLTGKIISVDDPWSAQFKNITVTIVVDGKEDKPVVCYRIKGEGADTLAVGDTITVTGELINYADSSETGKREFSAGAVVSNIVKGEAPSTPVEPETPTTPETPSTPTTPAEIVDALYALEKGGKLEGSYTLTGTIISIDTPWSDQFKNITFTIVVDGKEDKPVICYRAKGYEVEYLAEGDIITITGELINYPDSSETGMREFTSGAVVSDIIKGEGSSTPVEPEIPSVSVDPSDPAAVVDALYSLEKGGKLEGSYTLTGTVISIDDPWSDQYKNITFTIVVEGKEDKPVICFRAKGDNVETLAEGNIVTITGELINYPDSSETGKREFNAGAIVSDIVI